MKNVACIIARTNSSRLAKKVLKEINGIKLIEYIIRKIKLCKNVDEIYLCTSIDEEDAVLLEVANKNDVKSFAGSRESVIDRMISVAKIENAENLIRITGDNIFTDEVYLDLMIEHHQKYAKDYTRTEYLPLGTTSEVIKLEALIDCYNKIPPQYSEYLSLYMFQPDNYNCQVLIPPIEHQHPDWSLTVDTQEDWDRTVKIIGEQQNILNYQDIVNICNRSSIDHLVIKEQNSIKLPAEVKISYQAYRCEIEYRIRKAPKINISINDYSRISNEQKN